MSAPRPLSLTPALVPQQGIGPGGIGLLQAGLELGSVVDVVVTTIPIALIDHGLDVEPCVRIGWPQRDRDHRQSLAKRDPVHEHGAGLGGSPHANLIVGPMRRRDLLRWDHQDTIPAAQQVDLHRVHAGPGHVLPLLQEEALALSRMLVGRAEDLDRSDDAVARLDVNDLDIALGDRLGIQVDHDRLGRAGESVLGLRDGGRFGDGRSAARRRVAGPLDHANVGIILMPPSGDSI